MKLLLLFCLTLAQQNPVANSAPEFKKPKDAVFVVHYETGEDGKGRLKLEGLVDNDQPINPDETAVSNYYVEKYFHSGARYKLFHGGAEIGSVEVTGVVEASCVSKAATAKAESNVRLDVENYALATNSPQVTTHPRTRREANEQEKTALLASVRQLLKEKGAPPATFPKIEVQHLISTTLDKTDKRFLLGSFRLETTTDVHTLFAIFAQDQAGVHVEFSNYFKISKPEEIFGVEEFLDQLDIDGDGVDEIVTMSPGAEAYMYPVYQRKGNRWVVVARGAGGGC